MQAAPDYPGIDGFLGTRGSLMLDLVVVAMVIVLPVLGWSIWLVRYRRRYALHKQVQLVLGIVLLIAVTAFEADMRINGWQQRAIPVTQDANSDIARQPDDIVYRALAIHLVFATTSAFLWVFVIVQGLRKFPRPPAPGPYSRRHIFWARLAAIDMVGTAVTGWVFYWLAFVR